MNDGPRCVLMSAALAATLAAAGCEIRSAPSEIAETEGTGSAETAGAASQDATGSARHGGIDFVIGYRRGYDLALQQHKPMLVFFTAEWCTYCHQMEAEAFHQQAVVNLAREFVCVLVDADREPDVCREFKVPGYPTIQFLSPRGVPLNRVTGKQPEMQLISQMQAALQAVARRNRHDDVIQR